MSTQQDIYAAGSENRPPMLNKENYVPWSSRLFCYAKSRPNGKLIYNSIINGPYVRHMIPEPGDAARAVPVPKTFHEQTDDELTKAEIKQIEADDQAIQTILLGLPKDIYAAVDSCETAQEIWFTSTDGESIESYYHRFSKLMNDFKRNKHFPEKIASNLKFLNNLQPEWSRHVTIVHQTKDLHTADYTQLYDFLKYNQKEVDDLRAERLAKTHDPLALMANSNNPFNYPVFHQDQPSPSTYMQQPQPINNNYNPQPSFNQNYMQQPMPNPEDITDPTTTMNMALVLMAKAFKLNYSTPTNNNQRISSNPRNRQIAQPGMNMGQDRQMQMVGGNGGNQFRQYAGQNVGNQNGYNAVQNVRNQVVQNAVQNLGVQNVGNQNGLIVVPGIANQNPNGNGNVVAARAEGNAIGNNGNQIRCYNCRGLGHLARNCTVRPRRRDVAYLQTQLLIAQKEEAGIQLQVKEFDLMAAVVDLDEIEDVNANNILMANLQQASTSGNLGSCFEHQTILLGLPEEIYAAVDSYESAQEIWLRVQQMMKGFDIGIQEKKAKLFNEWERFTSTDGESIESYYHRFLKLMNNFKRNKHFPEKIASNLKFLNNLQPEWSRHVTIVHQTKDLHTTYYTQLYDFLKYNQKEVDDLRAEQLAKTHDPLALMANSNNPFNYPVFHPDQSSPSCSKCSSESGCSKCWKSEWANCCSGIANQNPNGNGNVVAAWAEGNAIGNNGNQIRCYNRRGLGHFARNCTVRPRRRDAAYLQTQLLIAQKEEAGIQLQAEEFDLMAAAADLDEIEEVNANCILMANLQRASTSGTQTDNAPVYDSKGSAEVHNYENCYDN
ncbi:retrovirus-related pol polyprotein from transposon TNT 1-94, partial [Tanacetum coccineum]